MLGIKRPKWCEEDRLLAEALQLDEDSRCPGCGHYRDVAWAKEGSGRFELDSETCHACALTQDHHGTGKHDPGEYTWPIDIRAYGGSVTENPFRQ